MFLEARGYDDDGLDAREYDDIEMDVREYLEDLEARAACDTWPIEQPLTLRLPLLLLPTL